MVFISLETVDKLQIVPWERDMHITIAKTGDEIAITIRVLSSSVEKYPPVGITRFFDTFVECSGVAETILLRSQERERRVVRNGTISRRRGYVVYAHMLQISCLCSDSCTDSTQVRLDNAVYNATCRILIGNVLVNMTPTINLTKRNH
jgi:hypothetical protein